jgi:hypothetical protein
LSAFASAGALRGGFICERALEERSAAPLPYEASRATWRSGYAAACKAVYTGSIPVVASSRPDCF